MDWKKYTAVIVFIAYIALIIHPFNIPIWIPWIGMTLLFVVIIKFTEISFYLYFCSTTLLIELAGGPSSTLFFSYIPLTFILKNRGLKLKVWWLILPLFALIRNLEFLPYIIFYGSTILIYIFLRSKEEPSLAYKTIISTDLERKMVRESITKSKSFPRRMSDKFEETLNSTVDFIFKLFEAWSTIILLKDNNTGNYKAMIGKSKGGLKKDTSIEKGPLSWFYRNSGILINNEYNDTSVNLGYYKEDEFIKCFLASSIEINGLNEGIIVVDRRERIPFSERDKDIIKSISESLSTLFSLYRYMNASMLEAFQFQSLLNLTGEIAGEIKLDEVRKSIFENIKTSFLNVWTIFLLKEGDEYYITEQDGRRYKRPLINSIIALALQKTISLCKKDLTSEIKRPILLPEERDFGAKSLLFSPFKGNIDGGILLLSETADVFNKKDLMVLNLISDIAASAVEKAILYEHEREKAIIDELTKAYNHRFFQEMLNHQIAESIRNKEPLSLIILDIDNFKMINDNYGHQTGDTVLKEITSVMKERIRNSDILSRYGGEEFTIILPKTPAEKCHNLAEELRKVIEDRKILSLDGKSLSITVSIGISEFPSHADNKNDLVAAADRALYMAKKEGKNKSIIAEY
ncbi:MAG: GGDEF domain-containing protein [Candidatus Stahlbacteria bacterium]|nr:MAG: GGDEF domain-containing protein [Candidatus Stahlbacteria bacterium]